MKDQKVEMKKPYKCSDTPNWSIQRESTREKAPRSNPSSRLLKTGLDSRLQGLVDPLKETQIVENGSVIELKDEEAKFVGREDDKMGVDRTRIGEVGISDDVRGFEPGRGGRRVREAGDIWSTIHGKAEKLQVQGGETDQKKFGDRIHRKERGKAQGRKETSRTEFGQYRVSPAYCNIKNRHIF